MGFDGRPHALSEFSLASAVPSNDCRIPNPKLAQRGLTEGVAVSLDGLGELIGRHVLGLLVIPGADIGLQLLCYELSLRTEVLVQTSLTFHVVMILIVTKMLLRRSRRA